MLHAALFQPLIPQNVGNAARTCVGLDAHLHIIGPTILDLSDTRVKRAGLDYWDNLTLSVHESPEAFLDWWAHHCERPPFLVTKFAPMRYDRPGYRDGDVFVLGNEKTGLPAAWHERFSETRIHLPMPGKVRSFNVGNALAVVLSHATCAITPAEARPPRTEPNSLA